MRTGQMNEFAGYLQEVPEWIRQKALSLREMILDLYPKVTEVIYRDDTVLIDHFTKTDQASDAFCAISVHRNQVNLDFGRGTIFHDPDNLLRSEGDLYQSIRFPAGREYSEPYLREMVRQAYRKAHLTPEGDGDEVPVHPILTSVAPKKMKQVPETSKKK